MAEVHWIKITTGMFEDEKIDFIESLPECDAILIIWIKLLTQAGKNNMDGFIFLTEKIPYTDEMLSHKFRRPLNTVKLALNTLRELEMIEYDNKGFLKVANWEKHQNIEGLEKIREQNRLRQAKYREKQKELESNKDSNVIVTLCNDTEVDIDIDKDTTRVNKTLIIDEWNKLGLQQLRNLNNNTKRYKSLKARVDEYSEKDIIQAINNVSDSDFLKGVNDRGWKATFDWLVLPNNFIKVLEGNYTNTEIKKSDKGNPYAGLEMY